MVCGRFFSLLLINLRGHHTCNIYRQFLSKMNDQFIFFFCVDHRYPFTLKAQMACIANLPAAFSIERRFIQYNLNSLFSFGFALSISRGFCLNIQRLISHKICFPIFFCSLTAQDHPIFGIHCSGGATARFLLLHFCLKSGLINFQIVFRCNQPCTICRKTIGII